MICLLNNFLFCFINSFCTQGSNPDHRPFSYNNNGGSVACGWSTFTTNLRESVTFIAAIINLGFIYTIITRRKIIQYIVCLLKFWNIKF